MWRFFGEFRLFVHFTQTALSLQIQSQKTREYLLLVAFKKVCSLTPHFCISPTCTINKNNHLHATLPLFLLCNLFVREIIYIFGLQSLIESKKVGVEVVVGVKWGWAFWYIRGGWFFEAFDKEVFSWSKCLELFLRFWYKELERKSLIKSK